MISHSAFLETFIRSQASTKPCRTLQRSDCRLDLSLPLTLTALEEGREPAQHSATHSQSLKPIQEDTIIDVTKICQEVKNSKEGCITSILLLPHVVCDQCHFRTIAWIPAERGPDNPPPPAFFEAVAQPSFLQPPPKSKHIIICNSFHLLKLERKTVITSFYNL